jgi:hypothetical protein
MSSQCCGRRQAAPGRPPVAGICEATRAWCALRGHPFVTYHPWQDRSWCRCGDRHASGAQPQDWDAKWAVFHNHPPGAPCRCYLPAAAGRS